MKILHLLSQRPDATGSGIYVQAMMRQAAAHGHDNYLVAGLGADECPPVADLAPDKFRPVNFGRPGLAYPIVGMSDVMPYDSTRFCDLSPTALAAYDQAFQATLAEAVDKFRPDVIHSHHLWIVSALAKGQFPAIPLVTTCHGTDLRQFQNCPHLQQRVLAGCRQIETVMALSQAQKKEIVRLYGLAPERIVVVGAGYDKALFYETPPAPPEPVQLVYAGKLSRAKGVPWLLKVLATIDRPDWRLHLVGGGSGPEKAQCLELADRLGDRVRLYGPLAQQRLAAIIRQAHILVLPSFFEGLPLVLLEGLAAGCRLVATDLPGTREIFTNLASDAVALVAPPRRNALDQPWPEDEALFEAALQKVLRQQMTAVAQDLPLDLSGFRALLDDYSWAGVFDKVEGLYQATAAGNTPRPADRTTGPDQNRT